MNKKNIFQSVVASALCVAMVLSIILGAVILMPATETQAATSEGNNFDFDFKKSDGSKVAISFIGDSITTYQGVSNSTSYNSTIGGNAVYYGRTSHAHYAEFADVKLNDTWWMQTINTLGMELCVNNSWSGSRIINLTSGSTATSITMADIGSQGSAGYYTRCKNLHNDTTGKKPDIVVVFLGTNDIGSRQTTSKMYGVRTLSAVDSNYTNTAWVPTTVVGAYAGMIRRIAANYPNAEIYCCTVLPQQDERLSDNQASYDIFYKGVQEVVNGYNTGKWTDQSGNTGTCYKHTPGVYMVDFYNESGIHTDKQSRENCYANRLHPNKLGMDAMSNLLISELMEHSQYMSGNTVDVTYDLANTFVEVGNVKPNGETMYGDVTTAVMGKPFQVQINAKGTPNIEYRVTMNGEDVTNSVVFGDTISIKSVTGPITIRAHEFDYFYWGPGLGGLESNPNGDTSANANALNRFYDDGTYSVVNGAASFDSAGQAYKMAEPINLLHDRNWELEFRMSGTFSAGALLLSYSSISDVWDLDEQRYVRENNVHLFRTSSAGMLAFGVTTERDNDHKSSVSGETYKDYYYHYGVGTTNANYGGNASFDVSVMHTYRMFNVYDRASDSNIIYLSIDGGKAVAMTYSAIAHKFDHTNKTSTYEMSGRDLTFNCIGTWNPDDGEKGYGHPLRNCAIEYIKVYENGDPMTYEHDPSNYYWEFQQSGVVSNPEANPIFTDNKITVATGSYAANGNFGANTSTTQHSLKLAQPAVLLASNPWILEYQAGGALTGGILLTSELATSNQGGNHYIHLNTYSIYVGMARKNQTEHYNSDISYETIATKLGITAAAVRDNKHIWRLENVINADGSNYIKLIVDEVYIGNIVEAGSNWSGQDMIINYLGTQNNYGLRNFDLDYMLIYENGIPKDEVDDEINNFRWDAHKRGMLTVDDSAYFTKNTAEVIKGSGVNGVHELPTYYQLEQSVNLLHDRDWNIEWRASGSWGGTDESGDDPMLFSSTASPKKNFTYIWRNAADMICIGYWASPGYHNYGINIANTAFGELNDGQMYTYRLRNVVERDANGEYVNNMVYLYIDGVEIGAMNHHFLNSVDQNETVDWVSGRDFTFDYIGNEKYEILDVNFEYLQVWEDGYKYDDSQLLYALSNWSYFSKYGVPDFNYGSGSHWSGYIAAYNAGKAVLSQVDATQEDIDLAYENYMRAWNAVVDKNFTGETEIHSVELVTGDYARVGKQVGLRIVTTPDIGQICVGTQKLLTCSSQMQMLDTDGDGVQEVAKVWLVTFKYGSDASKDGSSVTFGIGAWETYDANHDGKKDSNPAAFKSIEVPFRSYFVKELQVDVALEKSVYGYMEEFDPAGLTVTAVYSNGTSAVVNDYNILNPVLYPGDDYVTIEYEGATFDVPIVVAANVSQAGWFKVDINDPDVIVPKQIWVQGAYMGYIADDTSGIFEILLKDFSTHHMLSIQFSGVDELMSYVPAVELGTPLWVKGSVYVDEANFNMLCMTNVSQVETELDVIDMREFDFDGNAAKIQVYNYQERLSEVFQPGSISANQYAEFGGTMYLHRVNVDGKIYYTIHFNGDAAGWDEMASYNTGEVVQLSDTFYQEYYGESVLENLFMEASEEFNGNFDSFGEDMYPGLKVEGNIRGIFVSNDGESYQMMILSPEWVKVSIIGDAAQDAEIVE